jgi:hypothetical protein
VTARHNSTPPAGDWLRPFGLPRWAGALLYSLFWFMLIVPLLRRLRRSPGWNRIRAALALVALAAQAGVWTLGAAAPGAPFWFAGAAALFLFAVLCGPGDDPDRARRRQRELGAEYSLNGGRFDGGDLEFRPGQPLDLFLRGGELLFTPSGEALQRVEAVEIEHIQEILVEGEPYRPVYVSEAKDPPVRAGSPLDPQGAVRLELVVEGRERLRLIYRGAFARHLAETAAHSIHSAQAAGVGALPVWPA